MGSRIQLQQRNCSRFSRDFLRRSTFPSSQRTGSRSSGLRLSLQDLFNQPSNQPFLVPSTDSCLNFIVTGGAGFIGSNLTLALQEKFPDAHLTAIDDFRSGDFKNLTGYRGDFVAQNLATLDWQDQFGDQKFDADFSPRVNHRHDEPRPVRTSARQRRKFPADFGFFTRHQNANHLRFLGSNLRCCD